MFNEKRLLYQQQLGSAESGEKKWCWDGESWWEQSGWKESRISSRTRGVLTCFGVSIFLNILPEIITSASQTSAAVRKLHITCAGLAMVAVQTTVPHLWMRRQAMLDKGHWRLRSKAWKRAQVCTTTYTAKTPPPALNLQTFRGWRWVCVAYP